MANGSATAATPAKAPLAIFGTNASDACSGRLAVRTGVGVSVTLGAVPNKGAAPVTLVPKRATSTVSVGRLGSGPASRVGAPSSGSGACTRTTIASSGRMVQGVCLRVALPLDGRLIAGSGEHRATRTRTSLGRRLDYASSRRSSVVNGRSATPIFAHSSTAVCFSRRLATTGSRAVTVSRMACRAVEPATVGKGRYGRTIGVEDAPKALEGAITFRL